MVGYDLQLLSAPLSTRTCRVASLIADAKLNALCQSRDELVRCAFKETHGHYRVIHEKFFSFLSTPYLYSPRHCWTGSSGSNFPIQYRRIVYRNLLIQKWPITGEERSRPDVLWCIFNGIPPWKNQSARFSTPRGKEHAFLRVRT